MTAETRNCPKRFSRMFSGLKHIEPSDDEYAPFRSEMDGLGVASADLQAWSVSDFINKRPPTERQLRGMLNFCKDWDCTSNIMEMRFKPPDIDEFETAINDYAFNCAQEAK